MQSIGELFVSLGFDVDDTKLKSFDEGIKSTLNSVLKLAGVTASVAGFTAMLNGAADTATMLHNLSAEFGVNQREAQRWAAALHEANPLVSFRQGLESYAHAANYIRQMQSGQNNGTALGIFGGSLEDNTPEKIQARIRKNLQAVIQQYGLARTTQWLDEIYGSVNAVNVLTESIEKYNAAAAKGVVDQKQLDDLQHYNQAISDLGNAFDRLKAKWLATPAAAIAHFLGDIDQKGIGGAFHNFNAEQGERARAARALGKWNASPAEIDAYLAAHSNASVADNSGNGAIAFFKSMGWSDAQARGIVARLMKESSLNPAAIGDHGLAYGAAQWHPDRQASFEAWAGHNIRQSTLNEQLQFVNYELTRGLERRAGEALRNTKTAAQAEDVFTRNYERPAVTMNLTQNITSSGDPHTVAHESVSGFQRALNVTYSQTNLGAAR